MTKEEFREYYLGCDDKDLVMTTAKEIKADGVPITIEEIEDRIRIKRSKKRVVIQDKVVPETPIPEEGQGRVVIQDKAPKPAPQHAEQVISRPAPQPVPQTMSQPVPQQTQVPQSMPRHLPPQASGQLPKQDPAQTRPKARKRKAKRILIILPLIIAIAAASYFGIRAYMRYAKEKAENEKLAELYEPKEEDTEDWVDISNDMELTVPDGYKKADQSDRYIRLTGKKDSIVIQKSKHYDGSFTFYLTDYAAEPATIGEYSGYEFADDDLYVFVFTHDDYDYMVSSEDDAGCMAVIESLKFKQGEQNND